MNIRIDVLGLSDGAKKTNFQSDRENKNMELLRSWKGG